MSNNTTDLNVNNPRSSSPGSVNGSTDRLSSTTLATTATSFGSTNGLSSPATSHTGTNGLNGSSVNSFTNWTIGSSSMRQDSRMSSVMPPPPGYDTLSIHDQESPLSFPGYDSLIIHDQSETNSSKTNSPKTKSPKKKSNATKQLSATESTRADQNVGCYGICNLFGRKGST